MAIQQALSQLAAGQSLSRASMREVMMQVMTGGATEAQIGALLMSLRMKGETIDEITGAAEVMRELVLPVGYEGEHVIDLVGTGGDGANLFNVSTAAAFVAAAAGATVAKHGNRSVSSSSGSSDVLETLGVSLDLTPSQISECLESVGLGFMFAPMHHSAMKYAIGPRRELAMRTLFNVLGPLTNPAAVKRRKSTRPAGPYRSEMTVRGICPMNWRATPARRAIATLDRRKESAAGRSWDCHVLPRKRDGSSRAGYRSPAGVRHLRRAFPRPALSDQGGTFPYRCAARRAVLHPVLSQRKTRGRPAAVN